MVSSPHREAPGFFDLQVNGFAGIDFNDPAIGSGQCRQAIKVLWTTGVTRLLPTIITGHPDSMCRCLAAVASCTEKSIAGIHLEGPWISPADGPRGAHPKAHVCPPDREQFRRFQDAAAGRIRLVTLAPEWPQASHFIAWLVEQGVTVSLGHTAAGAREIAEAVRAGARISTHLGNGCSDLLHRHNNPIWPQLACDELTASFIVDGHHLPPAALKAMIRAKSVTRSLLVTDAAAPAGCEPGRYHLGEAEVELTAGGRVQLDGGGLAGSALRMDHAVTNVVRMAGVTLEEALAMAGPQPAAALGLSFPDDRIEFEIHDGQLKVLATFREGALLWRNPS